MGEICGGCFSLCPPVHVFLLQSIARLYFSDLLYSMFESLCMGVCCKVCNTRYFKEQRKKLKFGSSRRESIQNIDLKHFLMALYFNLMVKF